MSFFARKKKDKAEKIAFNTATILACDLVIGDVLSVSNNQWATVAELDLLSNNAALIGNTTDMVLIHAVGYLGPFDKAEASFACPFNHKVTIMLRSEELASVS